ncbi:hypothetical protein H4R20_004828 [Coemansia guatemalensis]|uniref:Uncharacterized protein n=1 Tax=Coemansia guatemalensis TaxID=2761395 RepID=A0A9W8LSF8_9FUNG|nr:hypothetical protein H4R20_004828 [Coemansia guatemalensis]
MISIFKFIAVALASSIAVLGSSVEDAVEKRALLPALLGNVDLSISACPDIVIGGGGGNEACVQRDLSKPAPSTGPTPPYKPQPPASSVPAPAKPSSTSPASSLPTPTPAAPAPSTSSPSSSSSSPVVYRVNL